MSYQSTSAALRYLQCVSATMGDLRTFLSSSPSITEAFGDDFSSLFEFEFSCFLTCVTDVAVYKQDTLRNELVPHLLQDCTKLSYISAYDTNGLTAADIVNDRMGRYGAILRGDWEPPAYWNMSGTPIPRDAFTQQLALLGDYLHYSAVLGEVPVGDDIESAPLGSVFNAIAPAMPYILFKIVLPRTVEYSDFFRRQYGSNEPKKKKKFFGLLVSGGSASTSGEKAEEHTVIDISDIPAEAFEDYPPDEPAEPTVAEQPAPVFEIRPPKSIPVEETPPTAPVTPTRKKLVGSVPLVACIAAVIAVLSCSALGVAYFRAQDRIEALESEIADLKASYDIQSMRMRTLQKKAALFDTLEELSTSNLGYASDNFRVDRGIVFTNTSLISLRKMLTLTTNWPRGGSVSVKYGGNNIAYLDFTEDSWSTSTNISVVPISEGITTATFSNSVNSETFKVIIVVTH